MDVTSEMHGLVMALSTPPNPSLALGPKETTYYHAFPPPLPVMKQHQGLSTFAVMDFSFLPSALLI